MQLSQWTPMRELAEAHQQFSHLFNDFWRQEEPEHNGQGTWTPAVDVYENAAGYELVVELPGMKPEAVEIEVKNNTLTIKGERAGITLKEGERFHHRERLTGRFLRAFRLSKPVAADSVSATYRDGILSITVPLRAEARSRKIPVQT